MRVIFLEDVPGTADAGEVREVKNGFARNFLLPRGLAAAATPDALQRVNAIEKVAQGKRVKESSDWQVVADAIEGTQVVVEARVGPTGRLFGAVTGRHIADKLSEATGRPLEHRQVLLGEAIHDPGDYDVNIRLYREVHASVKVSVVPEGYVEEQAARAALGEAEAPALSEGEGPVLSEGEGPVLSEGEGTPDEAASAAAPEESSDAEGEEQAEVEEQKE